MRSKRHPPAMLIKNQYHLEPGVYESYKGGLYVVETILNHMKNEDGGDWIKMQDPLVVYRNLEAQVEKLNGVDTFVIKTFGMRLSRFKGEVSIDGKTMKRFKEA